MTPAGATTTNPDSQVNYALIGPCGAGGADSSLASSGGLGEGCLVLGFELWREKGIGIWVSLLCVANQFWLCV